MLDGFRKGSIHPTSHVQLDGGVDVGLNRAAPTVQVFMGLSQRF